MEIVAKLYLLDKLDAKFECEYLDLYMSRLSWGLDIDFGQIWFQSLKYVWDSNFVIELLILSI
jgi:hypothetical protein